MLRLTRWKDLRNPAFDSVDASQWAAQDDRNKQLKTESVVVLL